MIILGSFFYVSIKMYFVGTHQKCLGEALLKNTHNIRCYGELKKNIPELSSNTPGPSCSKLTMSLVKDLLKFTSSDTQLYAEIFC